MTDTPPAEPASGFAALGLDARLVEALSALGYEEPTPIQRGAIPPLLAGKDLLGTAATGTGKTAAFALPLIQRIAGAAGRPAALVLVPTRELATQVSEAIHKYGRPVGASVLPVYGGAPFGRQAEGLRRGCDVVVATPGRALDHLGRGTLKLDAVSVVVLDEADEMLDMGFADDIEALLAATPAGRQTMLFSATMAPRIRSIAERHLTDPVRINIAKAPTAEGEAPKVRQTAYIVPRAYKLASLARVLDVEAPTAALIFCRTRIEVDELTEALAARGYRPAALHGGMTQDQRDRVMGRFKDGAADLLVATDVAARGLDIGNLTHVINYHVPCETEAYVHRIGRVGRAGRAGVAITLADPREHRMLKGIERATRQRIAVERLPTAADLKARRLDVTRASIREAILAGGLDEFRAVVESLTGEFDVMDVTLAAIRLAHGTPGDGEDEHIPEVTERPDRPPQRDRRDSGPNSRRGMARIYIGLGRDAGIGPRDLVGAIANEAGISGRDIGGIDIADRFSIVEVPAEAADHVVEALRRSKIRGRRATIRLEREPKGRGRW